MQDRLPPVRRMYRAAATTRFARNRNHAHALAAQLKDPLDRGALGPRPAELLASHGSRQARLDASALPPMQLVMAPHARGNQIPLIIASTLLTRYKIMVLQTILQPTRNTNASLIDISTTHTLTANSDDCGRAIRLNAATRSDRRRPPFPMKATGLHCRHGDLGQDFVSTSRLALWAVIFRMLSPLSSRRCALWTRRSRTASAMVGSAITSCQ